MTLETPTVLCERLGRVALAMLNRPAKLNALNASLIVELRSADAVKAAPQLSAIEVIRE